MQNAYINRGDYEIETYQTNYDFYDSIKLSSLNYFLFLNNENEVVEIHVGKLNQAELEEHIKSSFGIDQ
jgi:hypothetical protein